MKLDKAKWKDEHLSRMHDQNYIWCPLCVARKKGEDNPPQHLTPPEQDPSQEGMEYLKDGFAPDKDYADVVDKKGGKITV